MKKYLNPDLLPLVVLGCGMIGMLLQLWQYLGGREANGLLITGHISGILLLILTALVTLLIFVCTLPLRQGSKYRYNFPVSAPGCVGAGAAALGVLITSLMDLMRKSDTLGTIAGILGLLAAGSLCVLALCRLRGQQPNALLHVCVTVYLMLHLICQYRVWSGESQLLSYCWPLLATVCTVLSCYQSAAFDGNLGARRPHAFFHLAAVYFCCLSLIGDHEPGFFLAMLAWMFTDICRLSPMPRQFPREEEV
jgi:hypothetical protein